MTLIPISTISFVRCFLKNHNKMIAAFRLNFYAGLLAVTLTSFQIPKVDLDTIKTSAGPISGTAGKDGIHIFNGIPVASLVCKNLVQKAIAESGQVCFFRIAHGYNTANG
jgi:hypothetical protein